MALNGGATLALLCLFAPLWWKLPSRLQFTTHGGYSIILSVFAAGVVASGVRDGLAGSALARRGQRTPNIRFAESPQSLLITGGTGFIGQELCRALLADGHELTLLVRDPLKTAYLFSGRVHCVTRLDELDPIRAPVVPDDPGREQRTALGVAHVDIADPHPPAPRESLPVTPRYLCEPVVPSKP